MGEGRKGTERKQTIKQGEAGKDRWGRKGKERQGAEKDDEEGKGRWGEGGHEGRVGAAGGGRCRYLS